MTNYPIKELSCLIDLHSHILPKMDDGSDSTETSKTMLDMMSTYGSTCVLATPHFYPSDETPDRFLNRREESYQLLKPLLNEQSPKVILGAEVAYYYGIGKSSELSKLTLGKSKFLLLEMPFEKWDKKILLDVISISEVLGIKPIFAHIERYLCYGNLKNLIHLKDLGILMQCNARVFYDPKYKKEKKWILSNQLIHFVGTDSHNTSTRKPDMDFLWRDLESAPFFEDLFYDLKSYSTSLYSQL